MKCYKDRTYCGFSLICKTGCTCDRSLTQDIIDKAAKEKIPVSQFAEYPECFVPFFEQEKKK